MNPLKPDKPAVPALALRAREAAAALAISERTLWTWIKNGLVPTIKVGGTVLLPVDALRKWLDEQAGKAEGGAE